MNGIEEAKIIEAKALKLDAVRSRLDDLELKLEIDTYSVGSPYYDLSIEKDFGFSVRFSTVDELHAFMEGYSFGRVGGIDL